LIKTTHMQNLLPDLKTMRYGGAHAIQDPSQLQLLHSALQAFHHDHINEAAINNQFLDAYCRWLQQHDSIAGFDRFAHVHYVNGTSQAFDSFYMRHRNKRFRIRTGEYGYHKIAFVRHGLDWKFIDQIWSDDDALILSMPFADTGCWTSDDELQYLKEICTRHGIPVLLDLAYVGTTGDFFLDLNSWDTIEDVVFSLSKAFPVAHYRIGMRLSAKDYDDGIAVYNRAGYTNRFGAWIGTQLLQNFTKQYLHQRYHDQQVKLCGELDVAASHSVLFGVDRKMRYAEYNRGGDSNRLFLWKDFN
jgi:histidinol-phosphate/aromatic aminotransferase/cobyric acid decarboxylase-like protein